VFLVYFILDEMDSEAMRKCFHRDGILYLKDILDVTTIERFREEIGQTLANPTISPESGISLSVSLSEPSSWPQGTSRRVIEVVPSGVGRHWEKIAHVPTLANALDVLLGKEAWKLPKNQLLSDAHRIRHWYCPIVFPEDSLTGDISSCSQARVIGNEDVRKSKLVMASGKNKQSVCWESWESVNRRRVRGKGWHVDIGPGFDADGQRRLVGHPCHGVVILLLLSDWKPGGGGTAFLRGSHHWVAREIYKYVPRGIRHNKLNSKVASFCSEASTRALLQQTNKRDFRHRESNRIGLIEQVVGSCGSVVLMHPWLLHCGTTNISMEPRLMANGMACLLCDPLSEQNSAIAYSKGIPRSARPLLTEEFLSKISGRALARSQTTCAYSALRNEKLSRTVLFATDCVATAAIWEGLNPLRGLGSPLSREWRRENNILLDSYLPSVSIIIPVYNADEWLDECLASAITQSYRGPVEISVYNDASTDRSDEIIHAWTPILRSHSLSVIAADRQWQRTCVVTQIPYLRDEYIRAGGIGHSKNECVDQSVGDFLVFLDADDVLRPRRVHAQVQLLGVCSTVLVGGCWRRFPHGSTKHYAQWANALADPTDLWLEQFRETTVQMPTWCMERSIFFSTGGFVESSPEAGEVSREHYAFFIAYTTFEIDAACLNFKNCSVVHTYSSGEDLVFFHAFLNLCGQYNLSRGLPSFARAGCQTDPVLLYRW